MGKKGKKNSKEKKTRRSLKELLISFYKEFKWGWFKFSKCTLGILIFSIAINLFIVPNNLYSGGTLGISQLLRTAIVSVFHLNLKYDISSIIYFLINLPLFILAYKELSKTFLFRTLFTVILNSLFLLIIPIPEKPLTDDLLANIMIGGILAGIGIGMVLSTGSSSGGTDIIGIVLAKLNNKITVGSIGLSINVIIYLICGIK